ncbi:MAG: 5'-nucleotidase C-terminal domain-containing protein [Deltaproteobacteria bacterium]|jgi:2',3'-cyclic-nucleotide 2'-phosphodiesterase (5'-nucleotidase family)|nr:5'-nucleotidase C-terminal domain-containing protein [Deltaproteobacteria bacterium]
MPKVLFKILVTTDLHAQVTEDPPNRRPGLAKLAAYVAKLRTKGPVILLDAGDLVSGSLYGAFDHGRTLASLYATLGYRALLPGNHDFDYCPEENDPLYYFRRLLPLLSSQSGATPRVLALNLAYQGLSLAESAKPLILSLKPKVAVIGVMNPLTHRPSLGPILNDFDFGLKKDLATTKSDLLSLVATTLAPLAQDDGQTIVLAHLGDLPQGYRGFNVDPKLNLNDSPLGPDLAALPGATLVIDGHSHRPVPPHRPRDLGQYVNLGQGGESLAEITVFKDAPLVLKIIPYERVAKMTPEPVLAKKIDSLNESLGLNDQLVVLPCDPTYSLKDLWRAITPLGQLVVEAMSAATAADLAFLNKGALRAGLEGVVTVGSLAAVLPFDDLLFKTRLTGQKIYDLLVYFLNKGFLGLPLYHGLSLWTYPMGETLSLAGASLNDGSELSLTQPYSLAISGQMVRLLAADILEEPQERGRLLAAIVNHIKARANEPYLHDPHLNPYHYYSTQEAATIAFATRKERP